MDYSPKKKKPNNQNKRLNSRASQLRNVQQTADATELDSDGQIIKAKAIKTPSYIRGERIQKVLANLGFGSRREIERLIEEGKVKVNNENAVVGQHLLGDELIQVKGRRVVLSDITTERKTKIIAYHKPVGVVSTRLDEAGRPTVFDKLPSLRNARWVMIGRLDINTQGLLLFTNDGKLANQLMHPSSEIEREYLVRVFGEVTDKMISQLKAGIELEDGIAAFDEVIAIVNEDEDDKSSQNLFYKVMLKEGKNREVRRLWEAVGCQVSRLKRIRYGNYEIPKTLKLGKTIELTTTEINQMRSLLKHNKQSDSNERSESIPSYLSTDNSEKLNLRTSKIQRDDSNRAKRIQEEKAEEQRNNKKNDKKNDNKRSLNSGKSAASAERKTISSAEKTRADRRKGDKTNYKSR